MYKLNYSIFGRKSVILCSILIATLFINSVTSDPQSNGSLTIEKIDELNQNENIFVLLENIKNVNHESITNKELYVLSKIINLEIDSIEKNYDYQNSLNPIHDLDQNKIIDNEDVLRETKNCISSLSNTINLIENDNQLTIKENNLLYLLKDYLVKIDNLVNSKFYNNNVIINDNYIQTNDGAFQTIMSLILTILQFIVTLLKALLQGFITLFGGLIKTIGAILGIIILVIADIQTFLLLTGLYIISLGIMSKNIIKTLGSIGAPIFAAISAFLSIAIGSLLGSVVAIGLSITGVAIIFAIPLALVAAFLYFSGDFEIGNEDGLLYIITSSIAYYFKSI